MSFYKKREVRRNSQYLRKIRNKGHTLASNKNTYSEDFGINSSGGEDNLLSSSEEENDFNETSRHQSTTTFSYKSIRDLESICIDSGRAWISSWNDNEVSLVGKTGDIKKTVSLDTVICDISYSTITRNIWMCCRDKTIRELCYQSENVVFKAKQIPLSLCASIAGSVLVGVENQIIEYDINGKVIQKMEGYTKDRMPKIVYPNKIKQCAQSGDFAVIDRCFSAMGGNNKAHVIVLDCNLRIRFRYYGCPNKDEINKIDINNTKIDHKKRNNINEEKDADFDTSSRICDPSHFVFNPRDVCFSKNGRLLVADFYNKAIYLVNGNGLHIRTVYSCESCPCVIGMHSDDRIWIGDKRKRISLIKI